MIVDPILTCILIFITVIHEILYLAILLSILCLLICFIYALTKYIDTKQTEVNRISRPFHCKKHREDTNLYQKLFLYKIEEVFNGIILMIKNNNHSWMGSNIASA